MAVFPNRKLIGGDSPDHVANVVLSCIYEGGR